LNYEINKTNAPKTKSFIRPIPTSIKLNKTLLRYVFPKKDIVLLDNVISKINVDEPLTDYTQKIQTHSKSKFIGIDWRDK
jgi:hypothetical protein